MADLTAKQTIVLDGLVANETIEQLAHRQNVTTFSLYEMLRRTRRSAGVENNAQLLVWWERRKAAEIAALETAVVPSLRAENAVLRAARHELMLHVLRLEEELAALRARPRLEAVRA